MIIDIRILAHNIANNPEDSPQKRLEELFKEHASQKGELYTIGMTQYEIMPDGSKESLMFTRSQRSLDPFSEETTASELRLLPEGIKKELLEKGEVTTITTKIIETKYFKNGGKANLEKS